MGLARWCDARPWRHWLVAALPLLLYFTIARAAGLATARHVFAPDAHDAATATSAAVLVLGAAEDFVLVTLLLAMLCGVDTVVGPRCGTCAPLWQCAVRRVARFLLHFVLLLIAVVPFAADVLLLQIRGMRFTFNYLDLYVRESEFTTGFSVTSHEVAVALAHALVASAVVLVVLGVNLAVLDLSQWHLAKVFERSTTPYKRLDDAGETRTASSPESEPEGETKLQDIRLSIDKGQDLQVQSPPPTVLQKSLGVLMHVLLLSFLMTLVLYVTHAAPAVVSASCLNNSLNELLRLTTKLQLLKPLGDGHLASASLYIDTNTEAFELFQDDVLYRKTRGFKGPLAFNVSVDPANPPNVVVLVVESFRYMDSLYIVGNQSDALLKRQGNITLTPHFDRWAQRGVTFRNFWSSWQTSRSIESILFAQVPYDDPTTTGTTTGHTDVHLEGMPQFFEKKGYETVFTSGSHIDYDQWNKFIPAHGFHEVLEEKQFMKRAEKTKNVSMTDWEPMSSGGQERKFGWGVHDDLSFDILGDVVLEKVAAQRNSSTHNKPMTPLFLTHYTISSHTPYDSLPAWFQNEKLPDFSPLYRGKANAADVKRYATLRYFTDRHLGAFLDRMDAAGVLNDTIVVIVGDHGQAPESGLSSPETDEIATTRVPATIIAQGRLGNASGLVLNDAAEHYDLLNTLADIVGVPTNGFLQSGVGRSLKRVATDTRPVWSNNPLRHLGVILGHERLRFDRVGTTMELYHAEADPDETTDLFPKLPRDDQQRLAALADAGRRLSRYFKVRWDKRCITRIEC